MCIINKDLVGFCYEGDIYDRCQENPLLKPFEEILMFYCEGTPDPHERQSVQGLFAFGSIVEINDWLKSKNLDKVKQIATAERDRRYKVVQEMEHNDKIDAIKDTHIFKFAGTETLGDVKYYDCFVFERESDLEVVWIPFYKYLQEDQIYILDTSAVDFPDIIEYIRKQIGSEIKPETRSSAWEADKLIPWLESLPKHDRKLSKIYVTD